MNPNLSGPQMRRAEVYTDPSGADHVTHRTHLDPTWVPGQGQTRADNPKARYVVSRVARGQVYYKGTDGKGSFKMDRENWDENYS